MVKRRYRNKTKKNSFLLKKKSQKRRTKNNTKRRYRNKTSKINKKNKKYLRRSYKQKGGFVLPFVPDFKNLARSIPYSMTSNYNTLNPPPYTAPANPTKHDINPHPAYDQYLRGDNDMVDPEKLLGPNLSKTFDESIRVTPKL